MDYFHDGKKCGHNSMALQSEEQLGYDFLLL